MRGLTDSELIPPVAAVLGSLVVLVAGVLLAAQLAPSAPVPVGLDAFESDIGESSVPSTAEQQPRATSFVPAPELVGLTLEEAERAEPLADIFVFSQDIHSERLATAVDMASVISTARAGLDVDEFLVALEASPVVEPEWYPGHFDVVKTRGAEPCFTCHAASVCADCHVCAAGSKEESSTDTADGATERSGPTDDVARVASEVLSANRGSSASTLDQVLWRGDARYTVRLLTGIEDDYDDALAMARFETLLIVRAQALENPWIDALDLAWFSDGHSQPFLSIEFEMDDMQGFDLHSDDLETLARSVTEDASAYRRARG